MELYLILALLLVNLILLVVLLCRRPQQGNTAELTASLREELSRQLSANRTELNAALKAEGSENRDAIREFGVLLAQNQQGAADTQRETLRSLTVTIEKQLRELRESLAEGQSALRTALLEQIGNMDKELREDQQQLSDAVNKQLTLLQSSMTDQQQQFREVTAAQLKQTDGKLSENQQALQTSVNEQLEGMRRSTKERLEEMTNTLRRLEETNEKKLESMRSSISEGMLQLREENGKKLEEIRGTVDEKLQTTLEKRISESFKSVSEQLEQVYRGLGEMQNLASDVGGLKKVLSGVKTRGILGEVQLGAILEEILSPEQYATNVATIPGSSERVEFAVSLPAKDGTVYLPIDSKFPGERYQQLLEAQESGDRERIEAAGKALETVLRQEAKDIRTKYVEVPYTTDFGIMFLPFEGLYAEVVNRGLIERLQQEYHINVAGPSTMAALLNSLQMGFRTLAIQKRTGEVWEVLGAVKTEFGKFGDGMKKMQQHLNATNSELEKLMTTRTNVINRKLRTVQQLETDRAAEVLELGSVIWDEDEGL